MRFACLGLIAALTAPTAHAQFVALATAQPVSPPDKLPLVTLSVHPAAAPVPALKYMLLPEERDLKPGNAALGYQRAHSPDWWSNFYRTNEAQKLIDALEVPMKKMARDKVFVIPGALKEVDRAARLETCDWEMTRRVREDSFMMLLPDVQSFRTYGQMLAVRARLEMLDGKLDDAVYTFQTSLGLSRHIADAPILISSLVGMATAQITLNQVEEFVQLPDAPNLYWALHDLPRPFFDLRRPFQGEKVMVDGMFPGMREAMRDPKAASTVVFNVRKMQENLSVLGGDTGLSTKLALAIAAARIHPKAKKHFLERGWTAEQIEAAPVAQLALMYSLVKYDELNDEFYKWHTAPYWQSRSGLKKAEERLRTLRSEPEYMLASAIIPSVNMVIAARARVERRLAMLQTIEALRMYAAAHGGKLPDELDDVREVAIPVDPMTGKAFQYTLAEGKATLYAGPPPGDAASDRTVLRYELNIVPSKKQSKE